MKEYGVTSLLEVLKERKDIFICGPCYQRPRHLRAYAHGGLLCGLPTNATAKIIMPNPDFFRWAPDAARHKLENALDLMKAAPKPKKSKMKKFDYNYCYARKQKKSNEDRSRLITENLEEILDAMRSRFSTLTGAAKERGFQNIICCSHTDFSGPDRTVIFDWENSVPEEIYAAADSEHKKKKPSFDMVAFSLSGGHGIFSIIELKANRASCDGSSGLAVHAQDMLVCEQLGSWYKAYLIERLQNMVAFGLLRDIPEGLSDVLQHPELIELRKCFLFLKGEGLERQTDISPLRSLIDNPDDFFYMFAEDPAEVVLSNMARWESCPENA